MTCFGSVDIQGLWEGSKKGGEHVVDFVELSFCFNCFLFFIEKVWRRLIGCVCEGLSYFFSGRIKTGQSANSISSVKRR